MAGSVRVENISCGRLREKRRKKITKGWGRPSADFGEGEDKVKFLGFSFCVFF